MKHIRSSALYKGITFAIFNSSGKTPCDKDRFKMYTNGDVIDGKHNLNASAVISSWSGAEFFSPWIMRVISSIDTGTRKIELIELLPTYELGVLDCWGILLAKVGPTPMKKLSNFSQIIVLSVVTLPSFNLNLDCICKLFFLLIIPFKIDHVFFHISFVCRNKVRVIVFFCFV